MKTRIITAAVAIPLLLVLLLAAPKLVTAMVWGLLMAVAAYELLFRTGLVRDPRLVIYSMVTAFAVAVWSYFDAVPAYGILGVLVFTMLLFMEMMFSHVRVSFEKICMCLMAGLLIPFLLCSLVRILTMSIGRFVVLIPFIVSFVSDSGAYFAGMFFGRHKLAPVISPKKTIEGAIGGVLCAMLAMLFYALILRIAFDFRVNFGFALIYGLLGSLAGVMGDLCFSVVKRQTGIKDYGNLIPGHGGVLDRFDSMVLVGPLMEALLALIPVAVVV